MNERWVKWTDEFLAKPKHPMGRDHALMFVDFLMAEQRLEKSREEQSRFEEIFKGIFPYAVFTAHAERVGLRASPAVAGFFSSLDNLGTIVMYVHALRRLQLKEEKETITLHGLAETTFGIGFLAEEDLSEMWDNQKLMSRPAGTDNFLDTIGHVS